MSQYFYVYSGITFIFFAFIRNNFELLVEFFYGDVIHIHIFLKPSETYIFQRCHRVTSDSETDVKKRI